MELRSLTNLLILGLVVGLVGCSKEAANPQPATNPAAPAVTTNSTPSASVTNKPVPTTNATTPAAKPSSNITAPATNAAPAKNAATTNAVKPDTAKSDANCLSCHGPFDKLVEDTAKYVAPSGEKTSPHRYVPHNSKDIPECIHCHTAHPQEPLPTKGSIDVSKVTIDWCFSCHHEKTLQTCKDCHP